MSKQFVFDEVLNITVSKFNTNGFGGDPIFYSDYAKSSSVGTSSERLDLRGGQGNYKLYSKDHTKDATFNASFPVVDLEALGELLGKAVITGATNAPNREVLTASATNTITLAETPLTGSLRIYIKDAGRDNGIEQLIGTPATTENTYSIIDKVITLHATSGAEGTVFIAYYEYQTAITAKKISVTANDFPGFIRITGDGVVTDEVDGTKHVVKFDIKKAKVKPNFEFTMTSDGATEMLFECDLYTVEIDGDKVFFDTIVLA